MVDVFCLRHNHRTSRDGGAVGAFPVGVLLRFDVLFFNVNVGSLSAVGNRTAVTDRQPMCCVHRNGIVPRKSRCTVPQLGQRVVHKSGTVDTKTVNRADGQRRICALGVDTRITFVPEGVRRSQQGCRFCDNRIGGRKYNIFSGTACRTRTKRTVEICSQHRKSAESCHQTCAQFFQYFVFEHIQTSFQKSTKIRAVMRFFVAEPYRKSRRTNFCTEPIKDHISSHSASHCSHSGQSWQCS